MYSNNILNFQESTPILNACTEKVWKLIEGTMYNQNTIELWTKCCIPASFKQNDLGITKNYREITLTSIVAKIYNALQLNCIEPIMWTILRKNQNSFQRNRSTTSHFLIIRRNLKGVRKKNSRRYSYLYISSKH